MIYLSARYCKPCNVALRFVLHKEVIKLTHYPTEAHLSTLSHAIQRMAPEDVAKLKEARRLALLKVRQSTCLEERYLYGPPNLEGKK